MMGHGFSRQITEKCGTKYENGNYIWDTQNKNGNYVLKRREYSISPIFRLIHVRIFLGVVYRCFI